MLTNKDLQGIIEIRDRHCTAGAKFSLSKDDGIQAHLDRAYLIGALHVLLPDFPPPPAPSIRLVVSTPPPDDTIREGDRHYAKDFLG